ncbi:uncharacterized protein [Temnothorax longispinosus]|uniref:uncharacterized protein n=1 Tax=Temnothorax longispinosus TaxID=300112 RepID=UPI003A9A2DCE
MALARGLCNNMEQELLEQSTLLNSREDFTAWEQRCDEFIESLEEQSRIKRPRLSIGLKQSLVDCIARLEGLKDSVRQRFVHVGAGYSASETGLRWREIDPAFESRILTGVVINSKHIDPRQLLKNAREIVLDRVWNVMQRHDNVKINTVFNGEFVASDKRANKSIATRNYELFRESDLHEWYKRHVIEPILASLEEFQERDSGWALSRILNLTVNVNKYNPLHAGCFVEIPQEIKKKKAVINVRSLSNACFAWSVVAALYPAQRNAERKSSYPHYTSVLDLTDIEFPMTLNQIKNFENHNISINVYGIEKKTRNLQFYQYVLLTERWADICLHYFYTSEKLEAHTVNCQEMNDCAIKLPSDNDKWLAFKNHNRKERVPFIVYADLECTLEKMEADPETSRYTYQHHRVFSIGYALANNKYMQSYEPSKPSSYLMYFDVNNLYGWAMSQPLPYADFKWVDDVTDFNIMDVALDSSIGYILEVDLEYPQHLHDAHTDLPFCPTRDKPPGKQQDKLLATLHDKKRYPLDQTTPLRTLAKNDFEKNLYKLMNNAVFGKTMENVRNHVDVRLVTHWEGRYGAEAMIAKPNFHSRSVFSENLVAIEMRKLEVKFDKPIYVGMYILDISKTCLYEFHHEYMLPLYRDKCKVTYTDTDSLIYHIECDDVYDIMKRHINKFDTSDYAIDNAYGIPLVNKKIPGLMKDENNDAIMTEFVELRAKMYALQVDGKKDTKKAKGVKSNVVARSITFDDYTRCLRDEIEMT